MAKIKSEIDSGIRLTPQPSDTTSQAGDLETQASGKIVQHNGTSSSPLVTEAHTATLTNKTIDGDDNTVQDLALASLKTVLADANKIIQRDASGVVVSGSVIPSGNLVTDSSTTTFTNKTIDGDDNTVQDLALASLKTVLGDANKVIQRDASGVVVSGSVIPAGNLVTDSSTQTLTNKTIDGDDNTVQDLALASLKTDLADADKFLVRDASGDVVSNTKDVPVGEVVGDTDTQTLTNKTITDAILDGSSLSLNSSDNHSEPFGVTSGETGHLYYRELAANGTNVVGFKAPDAITADVKWVLPASDGTSGQVLSTDGSANLSWTDSATAPAILAGYSANAGQSIADGGAGSVVDFNVIDYDAAIPNVTTGASWVFTVPTGGAGIYQVTAAVEFAPASWTITGHGRIEIYLNGAPVRQIDLVRIQLASSFSFALNGTSTVVAADGDTISIVASHAEATPRNLTSTGSSNYVCIEYQGVA